MAGVARPSRSGSPSPGPSGSVVDGGSTGGGSSPASAGGGGGGTEVSGTDASVAPAPHVPTALVVLEHVWPAGQRFPPVPRQPASQSLLVAQTRPDVAVPQSVSELQPHVLLARHAEPEPDASQFAVLPVVHSTHFLSVVSQTSPPSHCESCKQPTHWLVDVSQMGKRGFVQPQGPPSFTGPASLTGVAESGFPTGPVSGVEASPVAEPVVAMRCASVKRFSTLK